MLIHVGMRPSMSAIGSCGNETEYERNWIGACLSMSESDRRSKTGITTRKKVRREPVSCEGGCSFFFWMRENSEWINGRGQAHVAQQMAMQEEMPPNGPVVILNSRTR